NQSSGTSVNLGASSGTSLYFVEIASGVNVTGHLNYSKDVAIFALGGDVSVGGQIDAGGNLLISASDLGATTGRSVAFSASTTSHGPTLIMSGATGYVFAYANQTISGGDVRILTPSLRTQENVTIKALINDSSTGDFSIESNAPNRSLSVEMG